MDLHGYVDRIESSVEDPVALEDLRTEIAADSTLEESDRELLDERIGTYLADIERADPVDLLEPEGGDGASTE